MTAEHAWTILRSLARAVISGFVVVLPKATFQLDAHFDFDFLAFPFLFSSFSAHSSLRAIIYSSSSQRAHPRCLSRPLRDRRDGHCPPLPIHHPGYPNPRRSRTCVVGWRTRRLTRRKMRTSQRHQTSRPLPPNRLRRANRPRERALVQGHIHPRLRDTRMPPPPPRLAPARPKSSIRPMPPTRPMLDLPGAAVFRSTWPRVPKITGGKVWV